MLIKKIAFILIFFTILSFYNYSQLVLDITDYSKEISNFEINLVTDNKNISVDLKSISEPDLGYLLINYIIKIKTKNQCSYQTLSTNESKKKLYQSTYNLVLILLFFSFIILLLLLSFNCNLSTTTVLK